MSEASGCGPSAVIAGWLAGCLVMRIASIQQHASHDKRRASSAGSTRCDWRATTVRKCLPYNGLRANDRRAGCGWSGLPNRWFRNEKQRRETRGVPALG